MDLLLYISELFKSSKLNLEHERLAIASPYTMWQWNVVCSRRIVYRCITQHASQNLYLKATVGAIEKQASLHTVYRMITKHGPPAAKSWKHSKLSQNYAHGHNTNRIWICYGSFSHSQNFQCKCAIINLVYVDKHILVGNLQIETSLICYCWDCIGINKAYIQVCNPQ